MAISASRKYNMIVLGTVMFAGTLFAWSPFLLARWQMHRFCSGLSVGSTQAAIQTQAEERDYELLLLADGRLRVHDPRSSGRFVCDLKFGPQGLVAAE